MKYIPSGGSHIQFEADVLALGFGVLFTEHKGRRSSTVLKRIRMFRIVWERGFERRVRFKVINCLSP